MSEWQPIETAPKDGTWILGWMPYDSGGGEAGFAYVMAYSKFGNEAARVRYGGEGYWHEAGGEADWMLGPTHWMPLPKAPA
jgi:uncharacterized protein DUF551